MNYPGVKDYRYSIITNGNLWNFNPHSWTV